MSKPSYDNLMFKCSWKDFPKSDYASKEKMHNKYDDYFKKTKDEFLPLKYSRHVRYDCNRGWIAVGGEGKSFLAKFFSKLF
jgi:hypothetical protein